MGLDPCVYTGGEEKDVVGYEQNEVSHSAEVLEKYSGVPVVLEGIRDINAASH